MDHETALQIVHMKENSRSENAIYANKSNISLSKIIHDS